MPPTHILDTDVFSEFLSGKHPITSRIVSTLPGSVCVSVITIDEVLGGWYTLLRRVKSAADAEFAYENLAKSVMAFGKFPIANFDVSAFHRCESLVRLKLNVRKNDLRIAAIALELQAVVVTRNARDFARIPGLTIEDWDA
ncbi:MAG: type II toxin-antitoxin system VapC family toxin [Bacteroidales bacterium]|nr:type II toxin-antitoxin system VapC family toxin [Bacteroidales bacterium]